jgi:predicted transcriptional regulator
MTFAEIQAAVAANPGLVGEIATNLGKDIVPHLIKDAETIKTIVPSLTKNGFIVRTQDEEKSFLTSYESSQEVRDRIMAPAIREVHDAYDRDFEQLFGEKRPSNEKTYAAYKRKIEELKASKITDPTAKDQITKLQADIEKMSTDHKTELNNLETTYFKEHVSGLFGSALDNIIIALPSHLKTDEEKTKYTNSQKLMMKKDLLENITYKKDKDGNVIFYDGDKPLTSPTDGKPLLAIDIVNSRFAQYIAITGRTQPGTGTKFNQDGKPVFTTKQSVYDYLIAKGLNEKSKPFFDEYAKLIKENGITE